jgi:hypothetical protein
MDWCLARYGVCFCCSSYLGDVDTGESLEPRSLRLASTIQCDLVKTDSSLFLVWS